MADPAKDALIAAALATARLRAIRTGLLTLHKALLDAEQRRYERVHGRIDRPQQALQLVLRDPWFAWIRPLAELIVQADERLADDEPASRDEVEAYAERVTQVLLRDVEGDPFRAEYRRSLQDEPEVVMAHARVMGLLMPKPR